MTETRWQRRSPTFWLHWFLDVLCIQMNLYFFWWHPLRHRFWGLFCLFHRESVWYVDRCMIMIVLEDEGEEKMCCGQETATSAFLFPPVFFSWANSPFSLNTDLFLMCSTALFSPPLQAKLLSLQMELLSWFNGALLIWNFIYILSWMCPLSLLCV